MNRNITEQELFLYTRLKPMRYPLYTSYIILGAPAVLTNVIILLVIFCDKKLLRKSSMIVGLAGGNLFNGFHALGYGSYRVSLLYSNSIEMPTSVWFCMATMLPTCTLLGYAIPAAMQFVIGVERLAATAAFNWYRVHWSNKKAWLTVAVVYGATICAWVVPQWCKAFSNFHLVTKECSSGAVVDHDFLRVLFYFVIGTGTAGVISLIAAVISGQWRYKKQSNVGSQSEDAGNRERLFKNQLRLSRTMLVVAMTDFIFVVVPNALVLLSEYLPTSVASMLALCSTLIYCINSIANVFIYLGMNSRFRQVALAKLKILIQFKSCVWNKVVPVNAR